MNFLEIEIKTTQKKQKLSVYLSQNGFGKSYIKMLSSAPNLIKKGNQFVTLAEIVKNGDRFFLANSAESNESAFPPCNKNIKIVYEDDNLLVCEKPQNLVSIPTKSHYDDSVASRISSYYKQNGVKEKVRLIYRLDKDVSGLIAISKTPLLSSLLANGRAKLTKTYTCVLHGILDKKVCCEMPIKTLKDENGITVMKRICDERGEYAKSTFIPKMFNYQKNRTLCDVVLETGRTHQIRAHSAFLGHSVVGDCLYGHHDNEKLMLWCSQVNLKCDLLSLNVDLKFNLIESI